MIGTSLPRTFGRSALLLTGLLACVAQAAAGQALPPSALSVRVGDDWERICTCEAAPTRWGGVVHPTMDSALNWQNTAEGVEHAEVTVAGDGAAWRVRLIVVRIDPSMVSVELPSATRDGGTRGAWTIDATPANAVVALNAGQFRGARPWGWLVRDGREIQLPGSGPLAMALTVRDDGSIQLVEADSIATVRARGGIRAAIQSYPMLLSRGGVVPHHLRAPGRGVDVEHRDSRLAVGQLPDGRILIVLTRFEGLRGMLDVLPFGPTTPEMAALMGALGCEAAMLLDGGLSGQLLVRGAEGEERSWAGLRRVPLGLVFTTKGVGATASAETVR